jgi:hypothetical protein
MPPKNNLLGKTFGRLLVIEETIKRNSNGCVYWRCQCSCDNKTIVDIIGSSLSNGSTKSCGCLRNEQFEKNKRKYNEYKFLNDFVIGKTFKNEEFIFDKDDYDKIKNFCWVINKNKYVVANNIDAKKVIYFHRFILNANKEQEIDHINHQKNDNRKENLRFVSHGENMMNGIISKRNKTGIIGVCFDDVNNKWQSQIRIKGKNKKLGRFLDIKDAIYARLCAEKEYFGDYSPQKDLFFQYGIK